MLLVGILAGAVALELGDVSGVTETLRQEITAELGRAMRAETGAELELGPCPAERCPDRLELSVVAGITRMSWTIARKTGGQVVARAEISGTLQSASGLAQEAVHTLFKPAPATEAPAAAEAKVEPGLRIWPRVALAGAGAAALGAGVGFALGSSSAFASLRGDGHYSAEAQATLDAGYRDRALAVALLSGAAVCAATLVLSLAFD
ncbi:MAG: hypothetical protein U1E65_29220 [Myxococcota bacterium]